MFLVAYVLEEVAQASEVILAEAFVLLPAQVVVEAEPDFAEA